MTALRQRVREDMQLRGFAPGTQDVSIHAVHLFAGDQHESSEQI